MFTQFKQAFQQHFREMAAGEFYLFEVDIDKDRLWNLYLDSFPEGTNEVFRTRREHDCGSCRAFIKSMGNVVQIKDNQVQTVWGFQTGSEVFQPVVDALDRYIKAEAVSNVWVNKLRKIGTDKNFEQSEDGGIIEWDHLSLELPATLVDRSRGSEAELRGEFRSTHDVFQRSLQELSEESILTVLELIAQNSLYKGEEWKGPLTVFLQHKRDYTALGDAEKVNYVWEQSVAVGGAIGRIRNHSMGTLLINLSDGMPLDEAVRKYEAIVAPTNYKRPKAIFTQRMLDEAKTTIEELGYGSSLGRRFATLDDITVNNLLFSNRDVVQRIQSADVFADMAKDVAIHPKQFSRVEAIPVQQFIEQVLPHATEVEVLLENQHAGNMVSLIAPAEAMAPTMFKWNNGFGWAYAGNIADSLLKERVKAAGGKVDGVLRFSIQWNDLTTHDQNDLDAHCIEPRGFEIYYGDRLSWTGGMLDVDIIRPMRNIPAVENITWADRRMLRTGTYQFFVRGFSNRGGREGFRAEVECDGQIYTFDYNREVRESEKVAVADVTYTEGGGFSIREFLPSQASSREVWGLKTNQFVPASVIMYSPNYWDAQEGIGHRHVFFMLKGCVNPERPNGFFNEYLKEDLMPHKRVFEALGSRLAVQDTPDQLSGVGFSTTKRNTVVVKVKGQTERVLKVLI